MLDHPPSFRNDYRDEILLSMFDPERDQVRKTYQLCRMGFAIIAGALVVASIDSVLGLFDNFEPGLVMWLLHGASWLEWVDTPIVWCCLIGATLLWGRWDIPSWQRRSGLLLVMFLVDIGLWFVASGELLGLHIGRSEHDWLRRHVGQALGWAEFTLLSSLSCDYLVHLGVEHARESDKSIRSMAATGAMVWMLLFCQQTDWGRGWPLQERVRRIGGLGVEGQLLRHGSLLIWTITLIQVTALVISAVRQTSRVLEEMDHEDQEHDLLRSPSDSSRGFLSMKSDPSEDDLFA
jgi:hypothetical protein